MKFYRFIFLSLLSHHSLNLSAQDTTRTYFSSGKLRALQVKLDSTHIWKQSFYESGALEVEMTALIRPETKENLVEAMKIYYDNGVLHGLVNDSVEIRYDADGAIYQYSIRKDHRKNGHARTYLDHKLWLDVTYKDDKKEGWMLDYDTAQRIRSKTYFQNDQQCGPAQFYRKGKLVKTIEYKNGCPVKAEYFDAKGHLLRTVLNKKDIYMEEGKPVGCK